MQSPSCSRRLHAFAGVAALAVLLPGWAATSEARRAQRAPDVRAEAAIIYDASKGKTVWGENADDIRPIGGLTSLMTAALVLDEHPPLDREIAVVDADLQWATATTLKSGDRVALFDLLNLLLVASDDGAARVLWRIAPGGRPAFVKRMNRKAASLGLTHTHFVDPIGVNPENVSSAHDVARLMTAASTEKVIASALRVVDFSYASSRGAMSVRSQNRLLPGRHFDVMGDKAANNRDAGYCLTALVTINGARAPVAIVVLGARSNADRLAEAKRLVEWAGAKQSTRR
jgi:D-alanyl-D-alanine endopeptidase (penicillin-binding protein 7)